MTTTNSTNSTLDPMDVEYEDFGDYCQIQCDVYCIVDLLLITVGIVANGLVAWTVVRDKNLKTPTFVAIASLAFADICFLVGYFAVNEIECPMDIPAYQSGELVIVAFYVMSWFTSSTHILLLSIIRFMLILDPLNSMVYLTARRTMYMSLGVWGLGFILGAIDGTVYVLKEYGIASSENTADMFIVMVCGSYFIPLVGTVALHVIKLRKVVKAIRGQLPTQIRQMSLVVTITLILFTILPLPQVVMLFIMLRGGNLEFMTYEGVEWGFSVGLLLNSCVNPFVYALFSGMFQKGIRRQFCGSKSRTRASMYNSSSQGLQTEMSSIN